MFLSKMKGKFIVAAWYWYIKNWIQLRNFQAVNIDCFCVIASLFCGFSFQGGGNILIHFPQNRSLRNALEYIVAFESTQWRSLVMAKVLDTHTLQVLIPGTNFMLLLH